MKRSTNQQTPILKTQNTRRTSDFDYYKSLAPLCPSIVYDTYWEFACKRQELFYQKINKSGLKSSDYILNTFKFTNVYRASDRVSQYLINNVIYSGDYSPKDTFYRIILFKIFNKIETWQHIERVLGEIKYHSNNFSVINNNLNSKLSCGDRIYSAAYIMPSGSSIFKSERKHTNHLLLIEKMIDDKAYQTIQKSKTLKDVYLTLLKYPTIGPFLAYQYAIDLNYSELINFSENDFVVAGPGAKSGISKCFASRGGLSDEEIIDFMQKRQQFEFDRLGLTFRSIGKRMPTLIDCQNIFCEVDKYSRIAHPEFVSNTKRTRIKQKYVQHAQPLTHFAYPPKWGIHEIVK